MKKNYLVVETSVIDLQGEKHEFTHFIDLKEKLERDVEYFVYHILHFVGKTGQKVEKVYFSEDRMTNW